LPSSLVFSGFVVAKKAMATSRRRLLLFLFCYNEKGDGSFAML